MLMVVSMLIFTNPLLSSVLWRLKPCQLFGVPGLTEDRLLPPPSSSSSTSDQTRATQGQLTTGVGGNWCDGDHFRLKFLTSKRIRIRPFQTDRDTTTTTTQSCQRIYMIYKYIEGKLRMNYEYWMLSNTFLVTKIVIIGQHGHLALAKLLYIHWWLIQIL